MRAVSGRRHVIARPRLSRLIDGAAPAAAEAGREGPNAPPSGDL
jgi:hypothetical protein